jgi:hypothetical protein
VDTFNIFNTKRALDIPINERLLRFLPKEDSLPYIPLAHVCRTLRAEFLPMFMARTAFSIRFDDIHALIECFIFPPTMVAEKANGQIVVEPDQQWARRSVIDLKPLLLLLEAAKGISFVFKHVTINGDVENKARDYTLQELLEALLGVDCSSFSSYARENVCSMMLDLSECHNARRRSIWAMKLEITLPERHWKPWMAHWSSSYPAAEILDQIVTDIENRGIGTAPPFTMYWDPNRITMFRKLERWPWVERLAQPAQSKDSEDM